MRQLGALVALALCASPAVAQRTRPSPARASNLFTAGFSARALTVNRVFCGVTNAGQLCTDTDNSPVNAGGFWPRGSPDQYLFASGLQIAGQIPATAGGGKPSFSWAGDTVGARFFDLNGTQEHGSALTLLYDSRDTADVAAWPNGGVVRDPTLFDASYLGRSVVSDQDLWARYWDGNPAFLNGRTHPMGIVVDQRAMAWSYPGSNDDIVYFVFTLYNVTARNAAAYANATIPLENRAEIAALGQTFQDSSEARFSVAIPDGGYALDSIYLAITLDPDVGEAGANYGTVSLPFGTAFAYKSDFREDNWVYPPEIFGNPPFAPAPGFVGTLFPRRPADIAIFTAYTGAATGFPTPVGVKQLWRYLSGHLSAPAGDNPCSVAEPVTRKFCFISQAPRDTRMSLSLGPFALAAGESKTLVLAYVFAAPLDTVNAYVGGDLRPGFPFTGDSIASDPTKITTVERAAGWVSQSDANGNGVIEASEVITERRSLLFKSQVAQAFVDHKFLVPSVPTAPNFLLVPRDNGVTVVWQPSPTETSGDPYYAVAGDPASALYDPNFRRFDVEGYRIYRGTNPRALELIAEVDYDTTTFVDYLGALTQPFRPSDCAPEIGAIAHCPVPFGPLPDSAVHNDVSIAGQLIQFPEGARIRSANGLVAPVRADTFPASTGPFAPLGNTGVTFVYDDNTVRNSFRYYYAVTAFDYNSIRSGPTSLESPRYVKTVTPRASSGQEVAGSIDAARLLGADGTVLNPAAAIPTLDPASAIFSGAMPPTNSFAVTVPAFASQLVADGSFTITIDSVTPGVAQGLTAAVHSAHYHLRLTGPGVADTAVVSVLVDGLASDRESQIQFDAIAVSDSQAARFSTDSVRARLPARATLTIPGVWRTASWGRADANGDPVNSAQNGPRWWAGAANENTAGPNELVCTPASGVCIQPDLTRNAGVLPGVSTVFHLQAYSTVPNTPMRDMEALSGTVARAADMRVYWGANGAVDSVVDLTHRVRVPYSPHLRASWGILTDSSFVLGATDQAMTADTNNALLTWSDAFCIAPGPGYLNQCGGVAQSPALLQNHARLSPVSARSSTYAGTAALTATGQGFFIYLNGHFFLMQMAALPTPGTIWNVRFYSGTVTGTRAAGDYAFRPAVRPPAVPGLRAEVTYRGSQLNAMVTSDTMLRRVHTVPDPFYIISGYELSADTLALKFVHLPARAIIRIYSLSGILVAIIPHDDATGGGEATWNLDSRTGRRVASGVYFYHIETPDGRSRVGRFTVITGPRR